MPAVQADVGLSGDLNAQHVKRPFAERWKIWTWKERFTIFIVQPVVQGFRRSIGKL